METDDSVQFVAEEVNAIKLQCPVCCQDFTPIDLKDHMMTHTMGDVFQCRECSEAFAFQLTLHQKYHRQRMHQPAGAQQKESEQRISCKYCSNTFDDEESLQDHELKFHEKRPDGKTCIKCDACDRVFADREKRYHHVVKSHGRDVQLAAKKYFCSTCKRGIWGRRRYEQHMEHSHPTDGTGNWDNAVDTVIKERPYSCDYCNMHFKREQHLQRHLNIHTGIPENCPHCNKRSRNREALKRHMHRMHFGLPSELPPIKSTNVERLFECSHCGKKFNRKIHLKNHILAHHIKDL